MAPSLALQRIRSATQLVKSTLPPSTLRYKHSLKSLTRPIRRALGISPSENAEFPRGRYQIMEWALSLIEHYTSQNELTSDAYRRRMATLTVKELNWYKEVTGDEHEFIVATIFDPKHGIDRYIRLDRDIAPIVVEEIVQFPKPYSLRKPSYPSRFSSSSSESSVSSLEFPRFPQPIPSCEPDGSIDTMCVLNEPPDMDKLRLMERTTFRIWKTDPAPTLLDLALVAKAVHENNNHRLWSGQCLWFSTMITRAMQEADFRHVITFRDSGLTFQSWMFEVLGEGNATFKARSRHREQQEIIGDIVATFQSNKAEVMSKIDEAAKSVARQRAQRQIVDEAVAQRDRAASIAAEASASAVEATARAAEAAARAVEAEARAEHEARLRAEAEMIAREQAQRNARSEAELRELRRRIAEFQSSY